MAHHYQKRWVFTWNDCGNDDVPCPQQLSQFLDSLCEEGVYQVESGHKTNNHHYQGRFVLKGPRIGKKKLLSIFKENYDTMNLTVEPEITFDSTRYCTKEDTRISGPYFVGLSSYKQKKEKMEIQLYNWQKSVLELLDPCYGNKFRDRKVIWIQDMIGGSGKSKFIQYLARSGEISHNLVCKKLPFDNPDRIRSAVSKIALKTDVDVFMFDFTRTRSEFADIESLFQVIEEIKNSYVVDVMYGKYVETFLPELFVLVFTNEDIKDYRQYLSTDRWLPLSITSDKQICYIENDEGRIPFADYRKIIAKDIQNKN